MITLIPLVLASIGVSLILLSVVGLLKMKDLLLRLQVASKASTLGLIFCLIALAIKYPSPELLTKIGLTILFLFLTTPIAAQAIAKVGHLKSHSKLNLNEDDLKPGTKSSL